jgi:hypothetical protein
MQTRIVVHYLVNWLCMFYADNSGRFYPGASECFCEGGYNFLISPTPSFQTLSTSSPQMYDCDWQSPWSKNSFFDRFNANLHFSTFMQFKCGLFKNITFYEIVKKNVKYTSISVEGGTCRIVLVPHCPPPPCNSDVPGFICKVKYLKCRLSKSISQEYLCGANVAAVFL